MDKKKILILYTGKDEYLESFSVALKNQYGDSIEVFEEDLFSAKHKKISKSFKKKIINPQICKSKTLYGRLKHLGGRKFSKFINHLFMPNKIRYIINQIKPFHPDIIVSTNYFLTLCAIDYKKKYNRASKVVAYNTEINNHKWWLNKDNIYVVNNDTAFFDAIGLKKYSPALVRQIKFEKPKYISRLTLSKEECRENLKISNEEFCILLDKLDKKTFKIIRRVSSLKEKITFYIFISSKQKEEKIRKILKIYCKNNANFNLIAENDENRLKYFKAADVFFTTTNYLNIKDSIYLGTPILVYEKCSWREPIDRFFITHMCAGENIFLPAVVKAYVKAWIKDPAKLEKYIQNIKKKFDNPAVKSTLADIVYEESIKPITIVDKDGYRNLLYELALESKFDTATTPINIFSQKELLSYEQIRKNNFLRKLYSFFVRGILKVAAPIINFFGFGIKIKGKKNLKGVNSGITISNHVHYLDCIWNFQALSHKKNVYFTAAPFNFKKGFAGESLVAAGLIPLAVSFSQQKDLEKYVADIVAKKGFVHFYPEQAMWLKWEQSRPLKKGAFFYASKNNVPIIPIIMLFKQSKFRKKHKNLVVKICKPIYPDANLSQNENCRIMQETAQKVYDDTIIDFYNYNRENYSMNSVQKSIDK